MKMIKLLICLSIISAGFSACRDKEMPVTSSVLRMLYSLPLTEQVDIYKFVSIDDDIIYNNGIVVGSFENGKRSLKMIDLNTKETRWVWNDNTELAFAIKHMYLYSNFLVVLLRKDVYCIDLNTGKTNYSFNKSFYFENWVSGIGSTFFCSTFDESTGYQADLFKGNTSTGDFDKYLTPNYEKEFPAKNPLGRVIYKITATAYENDTLLFLPYIEPNPPYYVFPKMGLFNMSKNKWLYQNIKVVDPAENYQTMPNGAKIIGDKVYLACGHNLVCYELLTGKEIWRRNDFLHEFPFAFFGYEIYGNKLIAHTQGGRTYAIDVNTGQNIWKLENIGDPNSFMHQHNGVLYYIAGGRLLCVDIENGQILGSLSSPDHDVLQERVVVVPQPNGEKAKVVIMSYKNMYVYEALK
ncbi:MAG: PQQ-binding-like beta-propeller repeat protein [Saprospiraceae bacterium]